MRPKIKISRLFAGAIISYIMGLYVIGFINAPFLFIFFLLLPRFIC